MTDQVFVAREQELAQLQTFLDRALAGQGQVCFVTGEAGAGKTALVTEFARRAQNVHPDLIVAVGQGDAQTGVGDPYLPFREVLGLLTGDVETKLAQGAITQENAGRLRDFLRVSGQALVEYGPDLVDIFVPGGALATRVGARLARRTGWMDRLDALVRRKAADPGDTGVEQRHILEQYTNVLNALAAEQPLMLVVDDLQWADAASIGLLFRLGRRVGDSRILIVGAYRPAEVALGRGGARHPLEKVLSELKRTYGDVWLDLAEVEEPERRRFVDALLETEPNRLGEDFRRVLSHHTGGHPLFTIELLRAMQERGDLILDDAGHWVEGPVLDWKTLPARVEGAIEVRVGQLEPGLREILSVASVEGEVFTAQVVAQVQGMEERLLLRRLAQGLEGQHRLVKEQAEVQIGPGRICRYKFGHVLVQNYLYGQLSRAERRLLHGEVAAALESFYGERRDGIAVQLAHHYHRAGDEGRAFQYFTLAADNAARIYANDEAIAHYTRAIDIAERASTDAAPVAKAHRGRGLAYETLGEFELARADHETALQIARAAGERQVEWRGLLDLWENCGPLATMTRPATIFNGHWNWHTGWVIRRFWRAV